MTKILSILLGAMCFSTAAFSQTALQPKGSTTFGLQVGVNLASVAASNNGVNGNTDYRAGLNAGIAIEHYFSEAWSFKVQGLYDQKGWGNGFISNGSATVTTDYKLDYVTVPLLANWHFGRTRNWYLQFGPYISFLTTAQTVVNKMDMKPYFNSTDGGLDLGIGVKFPVAEKVRFFIEFNGQAGIANINKTGPNNVFNADIRSSVSALNIGLNF